MSSFNKFVPYRGELGSLLIIDEAGLAFIERMLEKGIVDLNQIDSAYFWRVNPGMLDGLFDRQIEAAAASGRILSFSLDALGKLRQAALKKKGYDQSSYLDQYGAEKIVAKFFPGYLEDGKFNWLEDDILAQDGDMISVAVREEFYSAYHSFGGVATIGDVGFWAGEGLFAYRIKSREREFIAILKGDFHLVTWMHIPLDETIQRLEEHPKVTEYYRILNAGVDGGAEWERLLEEEILENRANFLR